MTRVGFSLLSKTGKKKKSLMTEHIFKIFFRSPHSNRWLRPVQEVLIYYFFNFTTQGQIALLRNAPTWSRSFTLKGNKSTAEGGHAGPGRVKRLSGWRNKSVARSGARRLVKPPELASPPSSHLEE